MRQTNMQRSWIETKRGYSFPNQSPSRLGNGKIHLDALASQRQASARWDAQQSGRQETPTLFRAGDWTQQVAVKKTAQSE